MSRCNVSLLILESGQTVQAVLLSDFPHGCYQKIRYELQNQCSSILRCVVISSGLVFFLFRLFRIAQSNTARHFLVNVFRMKLSCLDKG